MLIVEWGGKGGITGFEAKDGHAKMNIIIQDSCVCVSKQYTSQCRLSLPHAGADRSSRLWEERAGSQTVSRVQRILCLRVSLKIPAHIIYAHAELSEIQ